MTRHSWHAPDASARSLALLYRAWLWYGPVRPIAQQAAILRLLGDV